MIQVVTQQDYCKFAEELSEMHRLRYRIFKNRLGWDVQVSGDMEIDEFDALHPAYLLQRGDSGRIQGCARLLPSMGPNMLRDSFPALLAGQPAPASPTVWEGSRFALDVGSDAPKAADRQNNATFELFAGLIEFGLAHRLTAIVTVTDVSMERALRCATWPLQRIAGPKKFGASLAVAGYVEISTASLARVQSAGSLKKTSALGASRNNLNSSRNYQ